MIRLSFFVLLCFCLQNVVFGWLLGHVKTNRPSITQLRRNVAVSVIVLANIMSSPAAYAAVDMEVPVESSTVPMMTSNDVLRSDVTPRIAILKDIQFTFKLYPEYVNQKDYESFRKGLRTPPSMDLRKTCLKLKPFLAEDKKKEFENKYDLSSFPFVSIPYSNPFLTLTISFLSSSLPLHFSYQIRSHD